MLIAFTFFISCNTPKQKSAEKADTSKSTADTLYSKYHLDKIKLPPSFSIRVFAQVPGARSLCQGTNGTLFVGNMSGESVYAVVDTNKDGLADSVYAIGSKLKTPNGVAFKNGSLYVAEVSRILRYDDIENRLQNPPAPVVVNESYPNKAHHGWKFIAFGPDGRLYVPVGAPCNVCNEKDSIFATITSINADGTDREIYAKGVRNSVGFAWHPVTKELWFTDNGRDMLGDDIPSCEINHAPVKGLHFGFPYFHQGDIPDPEFGKGKNAADYTLPAYKVGPHKAPLGLRFYTGEMFGADYKNQMFVAEHGSWNRSKPIGYQVMIATMADNKITSYKPFAEGWLQPDGKVLGRPVDVEVAADGALLISDDMNGVVYRVVRD